MGYFVRSIFMIGAISAPVVASAQSLDWLVGLTLQVENIIDVLVIPLLISLALLLFIWGVVQFFIYGAADESARAIGRVYMLYAIIGLVIIVAVWGFVNLILQLFGVSTDSPPTLNGYLP